MKIYFLLLLIDLHPREFHLTPYREITNLSNSFLSLRERNARTGLRGKEILMIRSELCANCRRCQTTFNNFTVSSCERTRHPFIERKLIPPRTPVTRFPPCIRRKTRLGLLDEIYISRKRADRTRTDLHTNEHALLSLSSKVRCGEVTKRGEVVPRPSQNSPR